MCAKISLGIDIVEFNSAKKYLEKSCGFLLKKILLKNEQEYYSLHNSIIVFSSYFAVKEAVMKALSIGLLQRIDLKDIEVLFDGGVQKVEIILRKKAQKIFLQNHYNQIIVQVSVSDIFVIALVVFN
jgi:phosphopantetheine--protein transferase-like protein